MSSSLLLILFSLVLLGKCQCDLVEDFCSKSINPYTCNLFLRANPRSKDADARGLAEIAIQNAVADTGICIKVAKSEANPSNRQIINTCIENFDNAIDNLNNCMELVKKRDKSSIATLKTRGSAALSDVATCGDEFGKREPPRLKDATDKAFVFAQLLLIIANTL